MKLSLSIQTPEVAKKISVALLTGSFTEKLARVAQLGASGVELITTDPAQLDTTSIVTGLRQHNLDVSAISSGGIADTTGLTLLHVDAIKAQKAQNRLHQLIDFASAVSSPLVTIGGFRGQSSSPAAVAYAQLASILREAAIYAKARSVKLALEPLNHYEANMVVNVKEGLAFVDKVDHPALGLLLDTYHINIEENSWTEPFVYAMEAGKLWHVHIGDNNRLSPGSGVIDFHSIVSTLKKIGYEKYLSAELLAKPNPDMAAVRTLTYMNQLVLETE